MIKYQKIGVYCKVTPAPPQIKDQIEGTKFIAMPNAIRTVFTDQWI